jgi:hypothetical protein
VEGLITNVTNESSYSVDGLPAHLMHMINAGGLMPWLKEKYAQQD